VEAVQQLSKIRQLTCLSFSCRVDSSPQLLGEVLSRITQLRELSLWKPGLSVGSGGILWLLKPIASLPLLESLTLGGIRCGEEGVFGALADAPKLSCLILNDMPGLSDRCVSSVVSALTGLKVLDLSRNRISDAVMPAIASCLTQLTHLQLSSTGVTDSGVECLTALQQLQALTVPEWVSAGAKAKVLMKGVESFHISHHDDAGR
jgi:Ran GTPase-activating protein (RanGAP) involved in mRNA processing and transport